MALLRYFHYTHVLIIYVWLSSIDNQMIRYEEIVLLLLNSDQLWPSYMMRCQTCRLLCQISYYVVILTFHISHGLMEHLCLRLHFKKGKCWNVYLTFKMITSWSNTYVHQLLLLEIHLISYTAIMIIFFIVMIDSNL